MDTVKEVTNLLKNSMTIPVKDTTVQQVGLKLRNAFKRIKGMWDVTNRTIRKSEKKMEKLNEQMFELKEERENLENELEGIRSTYQAFCEQTGIEFNL